MKELSFREVIANIKDGEVWESDIKTIEYVGDGINIWHKDKSTSKNMYFKDTQAYVLKRECCNFEEAFKKFWEGKKIENFRGHTFRLDINNKVVIVEDRNTIVTRGLFDEVFNVEDLCEEWYILD